MQSQQDRIWILRILCWVSFLCFPVFSSPDFSFSFAFLHNRSFQRDFLSYFFLLLFFYANYFIFLPKFYFKQQYLLFAGLLLLSFAATVLLPITLIPGHGYKGNDIYHIHAGQPLHTFVFKDRYAGFNHLVRQYFFQFLAIGVFSFASLITQRWKQSEKARAEAELSYLKAKIKPHFLFNTLNSIYALAIEQSEHTPTALIQLSDLMRYVLSESDKTKVPLAQDIGYIQDYIALIRLRLDKNVRLQFTVEGDPGHKQIAPMMLVTFIEHAFNYGVNPDEPSDIMIRIQIEGDKLTLVTRNRKVNISGIPTDQTAADFGNISERLNYIYPNRHTLEVLDEAHDFWIFLSIFMP